MSKKVYEVKLFRGEQIQMGIAAWSRWACFALYCTCLITLPFALLWEGTGFFFGIAVSVIFLFSLGFKASEKISRALGVKRLSAAEAPQVDAAMKEYCRRLALPQPRLGIIESPAINVAVYGFSLKKIHLVITRGALQKLKREELSALVGRQLTYLWHGEFFGDTWLTQFLRFLNALVSDHHATPLAFSRRSNSLHPENGYRYSIKVFVRQFLLYPLALFPSFLLRGRSSQDAIALDLKSVRMTKKPQALAEGLRWVEAYQERVPLFSALCFRHLFLAPPLTRNPLGQVLLATQGMTERIEALGKLTRTIQLT